jgi:hypothetical protein
LLQGFGRGQPGRCHLIFSREKCDAALTQRTHSSHPVLQTRRRDENETGRTPSRNPENDREMSRQNENCPHAVFWRIEKVRKAENYRATSRRAEKCRASSRKRETEFLAENLGLVCNTDRTQSQLFFGRPPQRQTDLKCNAILGEPCAQVQVDSPKAASH